jgi:ATP-dependent Lon protease
MEVIRLSGYTEDEKVNIAMRYLVPKQMKNHGVKDDEIGISEATIREIVRYYTREAGVRNVEREIAKICRKVVKQKVAKKSEGRVRVTPRNLQKYLGVKRFRFGRKEEEDRIGQVTGLAWTEVGGDLLTIEAAVMPGKGRPSYTGQLGDIMQESIQAAMTVVRSRVEALGIDPKFYQKTDVHIHVPEGATPKDGPSAGVGMCTALVSALTRIPVRSNVAMTGEITLRGEVLPIGGLKEKLLAALRGGIETVLIPDDNRRELSEIPANILQNLDVRPVKWIDEVFEVALQHMPNLAPDREVAPEVVDGETPAGGDKGRKPLRTH